MLYQSLLLVGLGGFLGSGARFLVSIGTARWLPGYFPYGTFLVNIIGCFLIGILYGLWGKDLISGSGSRLWITGFCGGFTTFSSFSYDGILLLEEGRWGMFGGYALGSVVVGLLATYLGLMMVRFVQG